MKFSRWLKAILVALVVLSYPAAMHLLLTSGQWPASTLFLALLPFALPSLTMLMAGRVAWGLLSGAALIMASAAGWNAMLHSPSWIYLLQNLTMECLMAWGFGHTLRPGHEPLISQFARRIHIADYSPAIATYTRQATWAWTMYFVAMGLISLLLFVTAPLPVWSWFTNFVTFVLLGVMFIGEYAARRWRLRGIQHISFMASISMYWEKEVPAPTPIDGHP